MRWATLSCFAFVFSGGVVVGFSFTFFSVCMQTPTHVPSTAAPPPRRVCVCFSLSFSVLGFFVCVCLRALLCFSFLCFLLFLFFFKGEGKR